MQWLLLVIATIILCLPLMGYSLKVFRGEKPAPEVTGWGTLFIDGIKYLIVSIIYAIPTLIIFFVNIGAGILATVGQDPSVVMGAIMGMLFGFVAVAIVAILTMIFATIGIIRFARTGRMGEAFNFKEISATIGKIGRGFLHPRPYRLYCCDDCYRDHHLDHWNDSNSWIHHWVCSNCARHAL